MTVPIVTSPLRCPDKESPAPVEIMRGLASEFLDHTSPKERNKYQMQFSNDDIVTKGIVSEPEAQELLDM